MCIQKILTFGALSQGNRHISESVFVSFYENVEVFYAKGLRNVLALVHWLCCMPCSGADTPYRAECGVFQ